MDSVQGTRTKGIRETIPWTDNPFQEHFRSFSSISLVRLFLGLRLGQHFERIEIEVVIDHEEDRNFKKTLE